MSEAALRARDERRRWAVPGSSHDRVVAILRIALPIVIGVLVVLLTMAPLTSGRNISFVLSKDRVAVARERLRVTRAVYRGEDSQARPFAISAASAVQQTSAVPIVHLTTLAARLQMADGPAVLTAPRGRYDMDTQRLAIDGAVNFHSAGGYSLATQNVLVDLDSRDLVSRGAVTGTMPLGHFSADKLQADLNTHTVVLTGHARLHIDRRTGRAAK